ncbi:MAG: cystathionine beta-lyase [Alphaproteobacteria bacterium]|nr:MAG: cystathionine beta-lyase [Alphaproteobacteria bacterium]
MSGKRRDTRLIHGGRRPEWTQGIVNPPVWRASTILFDSVEAMHEAYPPEDGRLHYGRNGTPTQWALAEALTELEPGAAGTKLFPSGSAAVAAALLSVLSAGDELLMVDSAYAPTRAFCEDVLKRMGIATRYYDPLVGEGIAELFTERTKAVFLESPGSLTFEVQDVPAICAAARARGDLSIIACTKYVVGHADAMLGSVTAAPGVWRRLERTTRALGQHVGPDDAYLATRGLRTLGVRLRQHQESGLKVAGWLQEQPQVARVLHPALPSCPGHEHWQRDFRGASGLFSFVLNGGGEADRARLVDGLELFGIGYSWGGYESLALPVDPERNRSATRWQAEGPLVRLHIGLEDSDDLIEDLARGLAGYGAAG